MAVVTHTYASTHGSDAAFQANITSIHAAFQAAGLVNTADTGQIDHTTAVRTASSTAIVGYKMYRFDDALQATSPIYIKVGYGSESGAGNLGLSVQVGTATDGACNITGQSVSTSYLANNGSDAFGSTTVHGMQYDGNHFAMIPRIYATPGASDYNFWFAVSRTIDSTGTPTADGCYFFSRARNNGGADAPWLGFIPGPLSTRGAAAINSLAKWAVVDMWTLTTGACADGIGAYPIFPCHGPVYPPLISPIACYATDIPNGTLVDLSMYGTTRTYRATGEICRLANESSGTANIARKGSLLVLWE